MFQGARRITLLCAMGISLALGFDDEIRGQVDEAPPTPEEKVADLALLWQEANYNFVHFDKVPELDWTAAFQRFVPEVLATNSRIEHIRVLQRFIALLHEGHTNVVPPRSLRERYGAMPAVELDAVEGRPVVVNVGRALGEEVPIGSILLAVDGLPVDEYLTQRVYPFVFAATDQDRLRKAIQGRWEAAVGLLVGELDTEVTVDLETPDGDRRSARLRRTSTPPAEDWWDPEARSRPVFSLVWLDHDIALVALNSFNTPTVAEEFEAALPELARARAVIFDVRKNGGGNSNNGWTIGSHFFDEPLEIGSWRAREHVSAYKAWGRWEGSDRRPYYLGTAWLDSEPTVIEPSDGPRLDVPVAVLQGSDTYSAAEDFLALMRVVPGVVLVGGPSAGSTGQPLTIELSGGAWAAITAKRDLLADGQDIVGRGIQPDIEVYQSVAAFREGRDLVLEAAVDRLVQELEKSR